MEALRIRDTKTNSTNTKKFVTMKEYSFLPVVVETLGGWHPEAVSVLSKLARQLAAQVGGEVNEISRHFFQRLSILLIRGNSALIIHRTPNTDFADPVVDGDLDTDP